MQEAGEEGEGECGCAGLFYEEGCLEGKGGGEGEEGVGVSWEG